MAQWWGKAFQSLQIYHEVSETRKGLAAILALLHACSLSSLPGSGDLPLMMHCSPWAISFFAGAKGKAVHGSPPLAVLMERVVSVESAPAGKQLLNIVTGGH